MKFKKKMIYFAHQILLALAPVSYHPNNIDIDALNFTPEMKYIVTYLKSFS